MSENSWFDWLIKAAIAALYGFGLWVGMNIFGLRSQVGKLESRIIVDPVTNAREIAEIKMTNLHLKETLNEVKETTDTILQELRRK